MIDEKKARISTREACRRHMALDGADAQALEHALTITERERDDAIARARQMSNDRIKTRKGGMGTKPTSPRPGPPPAQGTSPQPREDANLTGPCQPTASPKLMGPCGKIEVTGMLTLRWTARVWADTPTGEIVECVLAAGPQGKTEVSIAPIGTNVSNGPFVEVYWHYSAKRRAHRLGGKMKIHYAGAVQTSRMRVLAGWAACCSGARAEKIRAERRNTQFIAEVTCRACLRMMAKDPEIAGQLPPPASCT